LGNIKPAVADHDPSIKTLITPNNQTGLESQFRKYNDRIDLDIIIEDDEIKN
jgi:hypothetical protein